ncbi:outer dynein arm-docking complex subunit 4 [Topomyia yanbarensis]|uniref:outer dynein arm-docking complex subunit 4 n=1 Tax=Topomyia yanbarensis TaxID=2498891 RepID=UPI00273C7970|nr:outer dynein arm-docking complex subunit 4 [Topomyia yanbarensis]
MSKTAVGILGGDDELLQSFVRVGLHSEGGGDGQHMQNLVSGGGGSGSGGGGGGLGASGNAEPHRMSHPKGEQHLVRQYSDHMSEFSDKNGPRKYRNLFNEPIDMKKRRYFDEVYTDKDRAAAVSIGSYDIKQNLLNKRRAERHDALQLPEQADPGAILALGMREIKNRNLDNAVHFLSKALDMNNNDQSALVARSKCYLQLGEPAKALQDAETALLLDKTNIRAIYQKAEALYYLGQFEHSLMFFHRGLRLRPELASFRLGVQKTQEAIENTIGSNTKNLPPKKPTKVDKPKTTKKVPLSREEMDKRAARRLLGDLYVDKEYLENLLKHPDLKKADTNTEGVSELAKDAINFLNNRQEFWRQQKPCTSLNAKKMDSNNGGLPRW